MATEDARRRLRSMGGIMASSPELIRAVEERLNPRVSRVAPVMPEPVRDMLPAEDLFRLQRRTGRAIASASEANRARDLATAAENLDLMGLSAGGSRYMEGRRGSAFPATPDMARPFFRDPAAASLGQVPTGRTFADLEGMQVPTALFREAAISAPEIDAETFTPGEAKIVIEGAEEPTAAEMLGGITSGPKDRGALGRETRAEKQRPEADTPVETAPEDLSLKIAAATDRQLQEPEPKSKKDLRSRYKENLALFKEIYGIDDEDRARDRMMSLAMIGLAIAAGQSPNALTNIAQGALTGLQGMSQSAEARRQEQRDLKTAALEAAMSSEAAAADAEARAAGKAYDRETQMILQAMKNEAREDTPEGEKQRQEYLYNDVFRTTLSAELENDPGNVAGALTKARLAAVTAAPQAPSALAGGAVSPVVGTPGTELPVITTREEFDALPSGAEFIQNGQKRRKP